MGSRSVQWDKSSRRCFGRFRRGGSGNGAENVWILVTVPKCIEKSDGLAAQNVFLQFSLNYTQRIQIQSLGCRINTYSPFHVDKILQKNLWSVKCKGPVPHAAAIAVPFTGRSIARPPRFHLLFQIHPFSKTRFLRHNVRKLSFGYPELLPARSYKVFSSSWKPDSRSGRRCEKLSAKKTRNMRRKSNKGRSDNHLSVEEEIKGSQKATDTVHEDRILIRNKFERIQHCLRCLSTFPSKNDARSLNAPANPRHLV